MTENVISIELDEGEIKTFWRDSYKRGQAFLTAADKVIRNYVIQEKQKGGHLSEAAKIGIFAYHYNYAYQALGYLDKLPADQKVLGKELQDIHVSYDFVQEMSPNLSEWEMLRHCQYGTTIHDLSGQPIEAVKEAINSVALTAWMGLTHQKFKEQANLYERIFSSPMIMPPVGPLMAYRKFGKRDLRYFFLNLDNPNSRERE